MWWRSPARASPRAGEEHTWRHVTPACRWAATRRRARPRRRRGGRAGGVNVISRRRRRDRLGRRARLRRADDGVCTLGTTRLPVATASRRNRTGAGRFPTSSRCLLDYPTCALDNSGDVTLGVNDNGTGDDSNAPRSQRRPAASTRRGERPPSSRRRFSCALPDGDVLCWCTNDFGTRDGTRAALVPQPVPSGGLAAHRARHEQLAIGRREQAGDRLLGETRRQWATGPPFVPISVAVSGGDPRRSPRRAGHLRPGRRRRTTSLLLGLDVDCRLGSGRELYTRVAVDRSRVP